MTLLTDLIDEGDVCGLLILILLLGVVGGKMIERQPTLQMWGLRFAIGVAIVFALLRGADISYVSASELVSVVLSGLAAGAIVLGPTWIVLAIIGFAHGYYRNLKDAARRAGDDRRRRKEDRKRAREQERQQSKWEREAPQRERAAQEAQQRQLIESQQTETGRHQREDARVACELLYSLREPDIKDRFSREQFDDFVSKYLTDEKPVEIVQKRAAELQTLIQQHYEVIRPAEKFSSLAEVTQWYEDQKRQIEALPIADAYRHDYLVRLNEQYTELSERVMESMGS